METDSESKLHKGADILEYPRAMSYRVGLGARIDIQGILNSIRLGLELGGKFPKQKKHGNFWGRKKDMVYNLKAKHVGNFSASGTLSHMVLSNLANIMFLVKSGILSVHNGFSTS